MQEKPMICRRYVSLPPPHPVANLLSCMNARTAEQWHAGKSSSCYYNYQNH